MDPDQMVETVADLFADDMPQVEEPSTPVVPVVEEAVEQAQPVVTEEAVVEQAPVQEPVITQEPVVQAPSDVEILRQQNERLLQTINELTQRGVVQPQQSVAPQQQAAVQQQIVQAQQEVQKVPDFKVNVNEDEFTDIMSSPEKFNAFFTNLADKIREEQVKTLSNVVDGVLPQRVASIVGGEVRAQRIAEAKAQAFVSANPDLAPHIAFVAQRHLEIVQQNPGVSEDVSLREAARISRQLLGIQGQVQEQAPTAKVVDANPQKPAFAGRPGPRPPVGPQMTEVQKEIHDLLGLDDPNLM